MRNQMHDKPTREGGLTLVEMIIVIAIIAIMAAVAIPQIAGYLRNYKVRGAAQQVAGEMQQARAKAIMGNVNAGLIAVGQKDPAGYLPQGLVSAVLSWAVLERRNQGESFSSTRVMDVLGVVDVVSPSLPGSSREILEYSGLPNGASRLRAVLPTRVCLPVGP